MVMDYIYDVALSFAGEDRELVESLALALVRRSVRVFYDRYNKDSLWGRDLVEELHEVYSKRARYCLMFVSRHYLEKRWPRHERRSALERQLSSDPEHILPVKLDDTELPGLPSTVSYVTLRPEEIDEVADLVVRKLGRTSGQGMLPPAPTVPDTSARDEELTRRILTRHAQLSARMFPDRATMGYWVIHTTPLALVRVSRDRLDNTVLDTSKRYSEIFNYAGLPQTHPDGFTRAFQTRSESGESIVIDAITCYEDGHLVTEGLFDDSYQGQKLFNPIWFFYEIQRHLQLAREVLDGFTDKVERVLHFEDIASLTWPVFRGGNVWKTHDYVGYHNDIAFLVPLTAIHGRDRWNVKMDVVVVAIEQVSRIFGLDRLPQSYWDSSGILDFAKAPGRSTANNRCRCDPFP
jgi:TIR domain